MQLNDKGLNPAILKRYNGLMKFVGLEHECIGIYGNNNDWNLKDTVCEVDYQLSTYYESGHACNEMRREVPDMWRSHVGRMKRYIARFLPICNELGLVATEGHCSQYD